MVLFVRSADVFYNFDNWDEASMMAQAWAMTRGEVLYRDVPQIHGVLNMAIFVPFFSIFSATAAPHAIKAMNLVLVLLGAFMIRGIARRWLVSEPSALLAAMIFVFALGRPWAMSSYGEFYTIFPTVAAAALLFFPPPRMRLPWRMLAVGALFSTALFIKQVAVFDAAALSLTWLAVSPEDRRQKLQALGWSALGGLVVVAAIAAYFFAHGAEIAWIDSMFLRVPHYTGVSQGSRVARLLEFVKARGGQLAPAVLAVAAGVAFLLTSDERRSSEGHFFLALLVWLAGSTIAIIAIGRFYEHYLLQLIPATSLASVYIISRMPPAVSRAVVLGTGTLLFAYAALSGGSRRATLRATGWIPAEVQESRALADAVRAYTRDDDRIFIYQASNLDVFFLSGRLPAAGITMFIDMAEEHSGDVQLSMAKRRSLTERPPALILFGKNQWWRHIPVSEAFFRDLLQQSYERVAEVEDVVLYRRR
jgi:hypothetical protein